MRAKRLLARRVGPHGCREKDDPPRPSAGARFFAEKARARKCVFLSVGLLLFFGQLSGPGKPGALSGPRKDRSGTRAGGSRDARAPKKGHPPMQQASGQIARATFCKAFKNQCVLKNATCPDSLRPASGNRIYSPTWQKLSGKTIFCASYEERPKNAPGQLPGQKQRLVFPALVQ